MDAKAKSLKDKKALPPQPLAPLYLDREQLTSAARLRKDAYVYETVHPADEAEKVAAGWAVHHHGKRTTKLKKLKSHHVGLEDRFWSLCFKMGYPILSG